MSVQKKKRFKNLGKIIAFGLFALLLFTNIKIATMDNSDVENGVVSIFGIELNLFEATYATQGSGTGWWGTSYGCEVGTVVDWNCYSGDPVECSLGDTGVGYCPPH